MRTQGRRRSRPWSATGLRTAPLCPLRAPATPMAPQAVPPCTACEPRVAPWRRRLRRGSTYPELGHPVHAGDFHAVARAPVVVHRSVSQRIRVNEAGLQGTGRTQEVSGLWPVDSHVTCRRRRTLALLHHMSCSSGSVISRPSDVIVTLPVHVRMVMGSSCLHKPPVAVTPVATEIVETEAAAAPALAPAEARAPLLRGVGALAGGCC